MKLYRYMSVNEFKQYLSGEKIGGQFVKGKACFIEGNIPARKKEIKSLDDLESKLKEENAPQNFSSDEFDKRMEELTQIYPDFTNVDKKQIGAGQLENIPATKFMSKVRNFAPEDYKEMVNQKGMQILVEFETKNDFDQKIDKVIRMYKDYFIQEVQSDEYSKDDLECISYQLDETKGYIDGIELNGVEKHEFMENETLKEIEKIEEDFNKRKETIQQDNSVKDEEAKLLEIRDNKINEVEFVKTALENARRIVMGKNEDGTDKTYLDVMLGQRIEGPTNAGSSYEVNSPEELYEQLISQEWEETTHPDVMPGCKVFKSNLAGLEGILNLDKLPDDVELYAIDPKETGKIGMGAGEVEKNPVEETYLIIGKENIDGKDEDVVFTFHPGEPVRPSEVETKDIPDGARLSKEQAKELGFDKVKYLSNEMLEQYRSKKTILETSKDETGKLSLEIKELENEKQQILPQDIGKTIINTETEKKDIAQKQIQMDLQKMQEITKNR